MKSFNNIQDADHIIVSISGGKDSTVLMIQAQELQKKMPNTTFHYVHAVIDIDWSVTKSVVEAQCAHFGVEPIFVQAVNKDKKKIGFLDILTRKRIDRKTGEEKEYMVPDMGNRWCTSSLKTGPIDKYARALRGNVLIMIGERWEEGETADGKKNASGRSELEFWRPDHKLDLKNGERKVVKCSPILPMREPEVWAAIEASGAPVHPCYSWGVKRASCAICIFSSDKEIRIAAEKDPEIVKAYIEAEGKISTSFRYKKATKTKPEQRISIADILEKEGFDVESLWTMAV